MVQADVAYPYYKMRIEGSTNKNEGVEKKINFYLNYHKAKHMQTKSFFVYYLVVAATLRNFKSVLRVYLRNLGNHLLVFAQVE